MLSVLLQSRIMLRFPNISYQQLNTLYYITFLYIKSIMLLSVGNLQNHEKTVKNQIKVHFRIEKQVLFGQAIYVVGSIIQLGKWDIFKSLRLNWQQGHFWTGSFTLNKLDFQKLNKIQYKFLVGFWANPSSQTSTWESGKHNRCLQYDPSFNNVFLNDKWNVDIVKLNLVVNTPIDRSHLPEYTYFLISNCPQLGNWKIRKELSLQQNPNRKFKTQLNQNAKKQNAFKYLANQISQVYSIQFQIDRSVQSIRYYYIRKNQSFQIQRHPGRTFQFGDKAFPLRYGINYGPGVISVFDAQNFNKPTFSRITSKLYVGSYLKTEEDVKALKQLGINCVCSIQTQKDHNNHGISSFYLELLCNQYQIKYKCYSIEDKNPRDFIRKCGQVIDGLYEFQKQGNRTYVHCTAGKYRSPQIIALYLILKDGLEPSQAIKMVKDRHPFANPNQNIIESAVCYIHNEERRQLAYKMK